MSSPNLCVLLEATCTDSLVICSKHNRMAELMCADLSNRPVRDNLKDWLDATSALLAAGEYSRAKLLLNTILQAHPACVQAHVRLVHTHLHLEQSLWPKALQIAR